MTEIKDLACDNVAVVKHMEMYQGIITRMAGNSASCKKWGVPFVATILGFAIDGQNVDLAMLALLTILIFYFLDSYYLMLENRFRDGFNDSVDHIEAGTFTSSKLFRLLPMGAEKAHWLKALTSFATWPVYLSLLILVVVGYSMAS